MSAPRLASMALALVPVVAMGAVAINLAVKSQLALRTLGLGMLFGTEFSGAFTEAKGVYGLMPALWGTMLTTTIAIGIALPLSLALAICSREMGFGRIGLVLRTILGALSGIPPIIYAITSAGLAGLVVAPLFCGAGLDVDVIARMPGIPPGAHRILCPDSQTTLLGGGLLALLVIPFMAPLIADALENVPNDMREASYALGGDRWYALRRVVLPMALPGIASAALLGSLKAMGDLMIVAFAVGYESNMPAPLWDILERTATLTSTGAGLVGGMADGIAYQPLQGSVASVAGLLLLLAAVSVLALASWVQRWLQKRMLHGHHP